MKIQLGKGAMKAHAGGAVAVLAMGLASVLSRYGLELTSAEIGAVTVLIGLGTYAGGFLLTYVTPPNEPK